MNARLDDIRAALAAGHIYVGQCPDKINPDIRDWLCPACRVLQAIDQVLAGQVEADAYMIGLKIAEENDRRPNKIHLQTMIAMAIGDAEARANHRALDLQYALDAEHAMRQPTAIDSGVLPETFNRAFWWRPAVGWQPGYRNLQDYIVLDHGRQIPLRTFTHWMPEPSDPTLAPPPAAEVKQ